MIRTLIKIFSAAGILVVFFLLPKAAFAALEIKPGIPLKVELNFCQSLKNRSVNLQSKIDAKKAESQTAAASKQLELQKGRQARQTERDNLQILAENKADQNIAKLAKLAKTPEQKQAVNNFKTAVENAAAVRKNAVETAITEFQKNLDALTAGAQKQIQAALQDFKTATQTAEKAAQTDCPNSKNAEKDFEAALKTAASNFQQKQKTWQDLDQDINKLKSVRSQAVAAANEQFKNTVNQAAQTLKKALK